MDISRLGKFLVSGLAGAALTTGALTAVTAANTADPGVRVRGTIVALSGDQLQVKSRDGQALTMKLKDGWVASAVVKANVTDIKPGDFVGIASLPKSEGGDSALEVLIFPSALKGVGEGSYGWNLKPNSTMTNARWGRGQVGERQHRHRQLSRSGKEDLHFQWHACRDAGARHPRRREAWYDGFYPYAEGCKRYLVRGSTDRE